MLRGSIQLDCMGYVCVLLVVLVQNTANTRAHERNITARTHTGAAENGSVSACVCALLSRCMRV